MLIKYAEVKTIFNNWTKYWTIWKYNQVWVEIKQGREYIKSKLCEHKRFILEVRSTWSCPLLQLMWRNKHYHRSWNRNNVYNLIPQDQLTTATPTTTISQDHYGISTLTTLGAATPTSAISQDRLTTTSLTRGIQHKEQELWFSLDH